MRLSIVFVRNFFIFLSALLMTAHVMNTSLEGDAIVRLGIGLGAGLGFGFLMAAASRMIERFNLRAFPFVRPQASKDRKKELLIDASLLLDARTIDLISTGLFDRLLVVPRFVVAELQALSEDNDENVRARGRRGLDVLKRLESMPGLKLRHVDTDFPEIKDPFQKLEHLAKLLNAYIFSADVNRMGPSETEGIRIVNIHALANALKPLAQSGEYFQIKIQRYGKEARQGVGYLEDGTMVVVNGGAPFIGDLIRVRVLSVKHTSSGRMVFCNALEEGADQEGPVEEACASSSLAAKRYFSI